MLWCGLVVWFSLVGKKKNFEQKKENKNSLHVFTHVCFTHCLLCCIVVTLCTCHDERSLLKLWVKPNAAMIVVEIYVVLWFCGGVAGRVLQKKRRKSFLIM